MNPAEIGTSYPGMFRRLAAMAYELLVLSAVLLIALLFPHILIGIFTHRVGTPIVLWAHLFLVLLVYFVCFWSRGGQTLAMKTWRIKLLTQEGRPVRPVQALLRYLLCWPSLALGGIGILWALFDHDSQFLHDRLAGTRLVTV